MSSGMKHGACLRSGCESPAECDCAYLDRRGQECDTTWCQGHAVHVGDWWYCARHGGLLEAVFRGSLLPAPLPDLNNRAASLAVRITGQMEAELTGLLQPYQRPDAQLMSSPVQLAFVGPERTRTWRKRWLLASATGADHALAVGVVEKDPGRVNLDIDGERIGASVPPWIDDRTLLADQGPEADLFRERMLQRFEARLSLTRDSDDPARPGDTGHYTATGGQR